MAFGDLPFLDSVQHYNTSQCVRKWGSTTNVGPTSGRRGKPGLILEGAGVTKTFDTEHSTLYMGAAFKSPASPFKVSNAINGVSVTMFGLGDGRFIMAGQDPTASLVTAFTGSQVTMPILGGRFYYLEMKAVIAPTSISVIFRINEKVVLTETYVLAGTLASHAAWASFNLQGQGGGGQSFASDIYVTSSGFYGDVNIDAIKPNAVGSSNAWTPVPVTANWNNVKEVIADDDTTIVSSDNVGDLDLYNMENITASLAVKGIQGLACVKKSDAGTGAFKLQYGSGGGALLSDEFFPSEIDYIYMRDGRESFTSGTDVNGIEFGYIKTS